jgi:eukaryotic translation initiation factor 2C
MAKALLRSPRTSRSFARCRSSSSRSNGFQREIPVSIHYLTDLSANTNNILEKAERVHTIKRFTFDPAHGRAGSNAKTYTFNYKDRQSGKEEVISVYAYFKRKYNVDLQHWYLPLISTERDGVFPMEACEIMPHQRYQFKLNPDQTSAMIKFAVTRPKERLESIARGVQMLNWKEDRYLNHFGVKMDPRMSIVSHIFCSIL